MFHFPVGPCRRRSIRPDVLELPDATDAELSSAFELVRKAERFFGGDAALFRYLSGVSRRWERGRAVSVLFLRCGRGDLARRVADWGRSRKWDLHVLACDRFGRFLSLARDRHGARRDLAFDVRDFDDAHFLQAMQFDYVVGCGALRHMGEVEGVSFLKAVNRLAKKGYFISDWQRDVRARAALKTFFRFFGEEARDYGERLVSRSWSFPEVREAVRRAGLDEGDLKGGGGVRFVLCSERRLELVPALKPARPLAGF